MNVPGAVPGWDLKGRGACTRSPDFTRTHMAERTEQGENQEETVWESGLLNARHCRGGKDEVLH